MSDDTTFDDEDIEKDPDNNNKGLVDDDKHLGSNKFSNSNFLNFLASNLQRSSTVSSIQTVGSVETDHDPEPPEPSSSRRFLSGFLTSDRINSSKHSSLRTSSLPKPLSELLLGVPNKSSHVSFSVHKPSSTDTESVTSKQSISAVSSREGSKHKGLVHKIKRTLCVGSGKTKKDKSKTEIHVSGAASEPCLSLNRDLENNNLEGSITVGIATIGRPTTEALMERLRISNKAYLEKASRAKSSPLDSPLKPIDESRFNQQLSRAMISNNNNTTTPLQIRVGSGNSDENGNLRSRAMSSYCDQAVENGPNKQIIYRLLEDFHCVIEKSFGDADVLKNSCDSLLGEVESLKAQLQCYETFKEELNRRIQELTQENEQLRFCLEEQCQLRGDLENIVAQLKEQIARQDNIIAGLNRDKMEMISIMKQLEVDLGMFKNQCVDLQGERDDLSRGMRGFELSRNKCGDLQRALAECCERCDSLQKDNYELRKQFRELEGNLDASSFEKNKLITEIECLKQTFQEEKDGMEAKICRLLEEQAAFAQQKADLCRKLNEAISAHHEEMDRLKNEADMYHDQLERERKDKEGLARTLRQGDGRTISGTALVAKGSCTEIRRQLGIANEKAQKFQNLYEKEVAERKLLEQKLKSNAAGGGGGNTGGSRGRSASWNQGSQAKGHTKGTQAETKTGDRSRGVGPGTKNMKNPSVSELKKTRSKLLLKGTEGEGNEKVYW